MLLKCITIITPRTTSKIGRIMRSTINAWSVIITIMLSMMSMFTMMRWQWWMCWWTKGPNRMRNMKSGSTRKCSFARSLLYRRGCYCCSCCCYCQFIIIMMMMVLILMLNGCTANIALMPHTNHTTTTTTNNNINNEHEHECSSSKLTRQLIDDTPSMQVLPLDGGGTTLHIHLQHKLRLLLLLNVTTPLALTFSHHVERQIYFNRTSRLNFGPRSEHHHTLVLPCALRGDYDIVLRNGQHAATSLKVEARIIQPKAQWSLLSHVHRVNIRNQNRVRKRELIVKWDRSKFDFYAVHYCLVFNVRHAYKNFCHAVEDNYLHARRRSRCAAAEEPPLDFIWTQAAQRVRRIDVTATNVICTGSRTRQVLKGLAPNLTYYLDIFGVHTRRQNLTFHIASTVVHYKRHHPHVLRANTLSTFKINEMHGTQVFSYKIPSVSLSNNFIKSEMVQLRYLILPCGGSEIDAKLMKQRKTVGSVANIYRPTYIALPALRGERYIIRFMPSNEDEILRANKVAIAVSTLSVFSHLPELPENITVFDVRTRCKSATIAWFRSPDIRPINYCIIVLSMPQRNPSFMDDYTNYCLDFGKRIIRHSHFHSIRCMEKSMNSSSNSGGSSFSGSGGALESHTILNLLAGESYLVYVTANLSEGKTLPYQSLRIHTSAHCAMHNEFDDSREQNGYY